MHFARSFGIFATIHLVYKTDFKRERFTIKITRVVVNLQLEI